jgi:transcriptional regulator with XRE-family HTH domain
MPTKHPLKAYREERGWTLDRMAAELRVKRNTVWRWENGRMPRASEWERIRNVTGIAPAQLVHFVNTAPAPDTDTPTYRARA